MPEGITEYRILPQQRRNLRTGTVVVFAVAVVAGIIAAVANASGLWLLSVTSGLCFVIFLYCYGVYSAAYTRFGPDGISGRGLGLGSRFEYRWEQVSNLAYRMPAGRGATTDAVTFTTTDGDQIALAVPVSGGIMSDPDVHAKYARMRDAWQAATGRTVQEERLKSRAGWAALFTLALVIQIAAAILAWGMISSGFAEAAPVCGVIILLMLAVEIGVPLYRGHRRRRRARRGRARLGLPDPADAFRTAREGV